MMNTLVKIATVSLGFAVGTMIYHKFLAGKPAMKMEAPTATATETPAE
jgi:hypothetical protein